MSRQRSQQSASIGEGRDPPQVRRVSRVGKITLGLFEQFKKTSFGIRFHVADRNALASQARFGYRNEETLECRSVIAEIGKPPIHEFAAGKREVGEAGCPEPCADPTGCGASSGDPATLRGADPRGTATASLATVASELLSEFGGEFHVFSKCLGGKHCKGSDRSAHPIRRDERTALASSSSGLIIRWSQVRVQVGPPI